MNQQLKEINDVLRSLLGSQELVQRWWLGPNINWQLRCPQEVWDEGNEGKDEIWNYVMFYGHK